MSRLSLLTPVCVCGFFVFRCGSRIVEQSAGSSSRVEGAVLRLGRSRRSHHPLEKALAQRAVASSPLQLCPVRALHPPRPHPPPTTITLASAARLPPSAPSHPYGARPFHPVPPLPPPRSRIPCHPPTPPACSGRSLVQLALPTPCPTTRRQGMGKATPHHPAPTSAGWTVAPT